jgi:hypothetical protein
MQRNPKWIYQLLPAEPIGPLGTLAACGWPWIERERCRTAIIGRRDLQYDCGNTLTKLCCGMGHAFEEAWLQGHVDPENQIAKQLNLVVHTNHQPERHTHSFPLYWWGLLLLLVVLIVVCVVWKGK